jgi:F-type H+-transporting ATPase subunit delta
MSDRISYYAHAMLAVAEAEGSAEEVSDELFRFARALDGNDELRSALTDQRIEASRRQQIVEDLLGGKASPTTVGLVSMAVGAGRAGELSRMADKVVELAADRRGSQVALVRTAVPLSDDQHARLVAALNRAHGSDLDVKVQVDPRIVGGIVTEIGDTVLDGSVRTRLTQLREAF